SGNGMVRRAQTVRRNRRMLLVNIAVPSDIEAELEKITHGYLHTVDSHEANIEHYPARSQVAGHQADSIVVQESGHFMEWLRDQSAVHTIREYREQAEEI
ncbi:glutamyl-tRNA reductase, partial [Morganella morganii]|nr:glutamyl-tRNA reductase [Morganella morganii]